MEKYRVVLRENSINRNEQFLRYLGAILWVESAGMPSARSHRDAVGLMQVTAVAAEHAIKLCPSLTRYTNSGVEWWSSSTVNVKVASCYLEYARRYTGSWVGALILYNGGFKSLTKFNAGATIPTETGHYVENVLDTINQCH